MIFIISSVTDVIFGTPTKTRGIISVQVGAVPQIQRLPKLGSTLPFSEIRTLQIQVSLSRYGGGPIYSVIPTDTCRDANTIKFSFDPKACGVTDSALVIDGNFFVSSYSFTKEINQFGQESWTLINKPVITFIAGGQVGNNKVMVRGISEGQTTENLNTGIVLNTVGQATGSSANIAAGNPGIGKADKLLLGVVDTVGGSTINRGSEDGSGQVTIPYSPIDI